MKISEITNKSQLRAIEKYGLTAEDLDQMKDIKELSLYFLKKNKQKYNETHREYFKAYYEKNKETIKAANSEYKRKKRLEKTIVKLEMKKQ